MINSTRLYPGTKVPGLTLNLLKFECNYSSTYDRVILKIDSERVRNSREFQYSALKNQAFNLLVNIENARVVSTEISDLSDELLSTIY